MRLNLLALCLAASAAGETLEEALEANYDCYDPAGESCTCTGDIFLYGKGLTGTIPSALGACTGITVLCVRTYPRRAVLMHTYIHLHTTC